LDKERPNTVSGLIDTRREIAGRIEHVQRSLVMDLDHIDAAIRTAILIRKRVGACLWKLKSRGIVQETVRHIVQGELAT
jgi:hypothetical protein